jgi:hypothetical protein
MSTNDYHIQSPSPTSDNQNYRSLNRWARGPKHLAPTLKELLNPIQEHEVSDSPYRFPGRDDEILAEAVKEAQLGQVPVVEMDEDSSDESSPEVDFSFREGAELCERLKKACVVHSDTEGVSVLKLQKQLQKLRSHFHHLDFSSLRQSTLDNFITNASEGSSSIMNL